MPFLYDPDRWEWALTRMRSYRLQGGGKVEVDFGDDHTTEVPQTTFDQAMSRWVQSTFAAPPGTYCLDVCPPDDIEPTPSDAGVYRSTVIGWAITMAGSTLPITVEGIQEDYRAILHPDGRVEEVHMGDFPSYEAFVARVREEQSKESN